MNKKNGADAGASALFEFKKCLTIDKIDISNMSQPIPEKLKYYEDYYLESMMLAHAIVVNENGEIRDGYISYILATKHMRVRNKLG